MRRVALWSLVLPLMLAGTEVAHALAYRIVYPVASVRWHVLAASGHGYMGYVPLAFGVGGAIAFAGFLSTVVDAARRRDLSPLPAWAFALLPLAGFTIQEFLERAFATTSLPWWMFEQPTFRVGVLLQLPFALVAYAVARLLQRAGSAIGRVVVPVRARPLFAGAVAARRPIDVFVRPQSLVSGGWSARGPPLISV